MGRRHNAQHQRSKTEKREVGTDMGEETNWDKEKNQEKYQEVPSARYRGRNRRSRDRWKE